MNFGLDSEIKTEEEDDLLNTEVKLEEEEVEEINPLQDCNALKVELKGRNNQNIYLYHLKVTGHSKFVKIGKYGQARICAHEAKLSVGAKMI